MNGLPEIGRLLIVIGLFVFGLGVVFLVLDKIPGLGRLPGDIYIESDNFKFYFPLTTCIILSIVLSLIFYLINAIK